MDVFTNQDDTVDHLCWRVYGSTDMVERVLDANPGLAEKGPILPMGVRVTMPPKPENPTRKQINLWD